VRLPRFLGSASLRTRVAIASAAAAAAVVAVFTILTSVVLANNDAAQLDRRLDSIIDASMYPDQSQDPRRGVLTTGRSKSTGQVVYQRGLQLPPLPLGTATVEVNGVEYRVRTITVDQQGGVLMSVGIRADSVLLNRARIPLYTAVGVVTVTETVGNFVVSIDLTVSVPLAAEADEAASNATAVVATAMKRRIIDPPPVRTRPRRTEAARLSRGGRSSGGG